MCIGKLDPESGEVIPSKRLVSPQLPQHKETLDPTITASAQIVGPSLVLDSLDDTLGLGKLLKSCFPQFYQQILMMAYYLVGEGGALSHCSTWCKSHAPSLALSLTSQHISTILQSITTDQKQTFLNRWMRQLMEDDYLCYDITSVSSYSLTGKPLVKPVAFLSESNFKTFWRKGCYAVFLTKGLYFNR